MIFSAVFVLSVMVSNAQRNVLRVDGSVKEEKVKLDGVSITLYGNENFISKSVTEDNGKFRFQLEYDSNYLLEFSKPGYVTKRVSVNTENVPPEDQDFGHEYGGWDLALFKMVDGLDISVFEKPFVKIMYNDELNKFEHDVEYTNMVKEEFESLIKAQEKKNKEEEKRKKEELRAAEKAQADVLANQKAMEEKKRKADLEVESQRKKEKKAAESAKAKADEEERKKMKIAEVKISEEEKKKSNVSVINSDDEYKKIIENAEDAFKRNEFDNAKKIYLQAQNLKPKESYPAKKIDEINKVLNFNSISTNKARRDTGDYKTKEEFLQALAKLYPNGITEEIYMEGNVKITRRIVVDGNLGTEYKMTVHPWGGRFWFKNGTPIIESIWNVETQKKK